MQRTLEKCERENGFIYYQKVPYDPTALPENSQTHGLVAPEPWEIPTVSPLWTPMAYAAFDDSKLTQDDKTKEKFKKEDLKPIKEVPITENEDGSKNESGCIIS